MSELKRLLWIGALISWVLITGIDVVSQRWDLVFRDVMLVITTFCLLVYLKSSEEKK